MCAIKDAKAVIITAKNDIDTIKTLITIKDSEFKLNKTGHITTQVYDSKNIDLIKGLIPNQIETVYVQDLKARIFARTCLQPGSSMVYKDLFSFDGSEIYFEPISSKLEKLVNMKFKDAVLSINNGYLIGISRQGKQLVNPSPELVINKSDELIVIAEDDNSVEFRDNKALEKEIKFDKNKKLNQSLNILMIGFNHSVIKILEEIDSYKLNKQKLLIMVPTKEDKAKLLKAKPKTSFKNYSVIIGEGKNKQDFEKIKLADFEVVCVFANSDATDKSADELDADTLLTILHLHNLEEARKLKLNFVTEILVESNVKTIQSVNVDDFMVSNLLLSRIITQISENPKTNDVIIDLISEDGSELYLKNASDYVLLNQEVSCYNILKEANKRKQLFIGYKLDKQAPILNPKLETKLKFGAKDSIIVVSED